MRQIVVTVDVTEAVGSDVPVHTVATVCLPDQVTPRSVVCFAWPGGGYSRRYFTFGMPGSDPDGQAGWHTSRGWVFVTCDHLHCGDSARVADPAGITYEDMVNANHATTVEVLRRLAAGDLSDDVPAVTEPLVLGIGQSMGGSTIVLQQGQRATFDAVGVLGWSAVGSAHWLPPGAEALRAKRFFPRGTNVGALTPEVFTAAMPVMVVDERGIARSRPCYFYDDVPDEIVVQDMVEYPTRRGAMPVWGTDSIPPCGVTMMSPGAVAAEAAMITSPVFLATGERDVVPTPLAEPAAYAQAMDITTFVCPRMGHMHNFASTRELLWARLHAWGEGLVAMRDIAG